MPHVLTKEEMTNTIQKNLEKISFHKGGIDVEFIDSCNIILDLIINHDEDFKKLLYGILKKSGDKTLKIKDKDTLEYKDKYRWAQYINALVIFWNYLVNDSEQHKEKLIKVWNVFDNFNTCKNEEKNYNCIKAPSDYIYEYKNVYKLKIPKECPTDEIIEKNKDSLILLEEYKLEGGSKRTRRNRKMLRRKTKHRKTKTKRRNEIRRSHIKSKKRTSLKNRRH